MFFRKKRRLALPEAIAVSVQHRFFSQLPNNRYERFLWFYQNDPDVKGAVDKLTIIARRMLVGFRKGEKVILPPEVEKLFIGAIKQQLIWGNSVWLKSNLQNLPMFSVTAVSNDDQIGQPSTYLIQPPIKYYIVNELISNMPTSSMNMQKFRASRVIHFRYDPTPTMVIDNIGRWTYDVWSMSPLRPLESIIVWKQQILYLDILWRSSHVPRLHHKIDLSMFDPENYTGSLLERISKARADAAAYLREYVEKLRGKRPDQDFVTSKDVDITVIEPKTSYMDPNQIVEQLSNAIFVSLGINESIVKGRSKSSYATEFLLKSYTGMVAYDLAYRTAWMIALRYYDGSYEPVLQPELGSDDLEKMRLGVALSNSGVATINEIRKLMGLPEVPWGDVPAFRSSAGHPPGVSPEDIRKYVEKDIQGEPNMVEPKSPHTQGKYKTR